MISSYFSYYHTTHQAYTHILRIYEDFLTSESNIDELLRDYDEWSNLIDESIAWILL